MMEFTCEFNEFLEQKHEFEMQSKSSDSDQVELKSTELLWCKEWL